MHRWMVLFLALLPASLAPAAEPADFSGTWSSTYGPLTLRQTGDRVVGQYQLEETSGLVEGTVDGRKLTFTYRESNASGEGWFELAADGSSFDGRWREKGKTEWSRWTGTSGRAAVSTCRRPWPSAANSAISKGRSGWTVLVPRPGPSAGRGMGQRRGQRPGQRRTPRAAAS